MLRYLILALTATPATANCVPPLMPVFSCNIMTADQRVEICASPPGQDGVSQTFTYNFASGMAPSELYFETPGYYFSTKYYRIREQAENTTGIGLEHGGTVYAVHLTGVDGGYVRAAQLHVYDSVPDFQSEAGETETLRLYCAPDTTRVNWDFIRP
ncbi:hypothetical protein [Paracoccus shanxieyensis]|uniref:Secreted protein n=1 Tax=Paracoccus shanxieyensis TaxID=2675752 RepID=A0A6L6J1T5_9RHOB|nr:hypothetical protein [Paracoccus shanxieyensis]MTH65881.1 hypothetical protein [Paracoccus shanxieyensis]MTH89210.1 hypothetical protein [Paracoccus shanxieyensis]